MKLGFFSLAIFFHLYFTGFAESATTKPPTSPTNLIKSSCKTTRYPDVCIQSLAGYSRTIHSEHQLAQTALTVSLSRARSTVQYVAILTKARGIKHREYLAVKDCIENMRDSVGRLSQSITELGHMGRPAGQAFTWHMSNVQTWVSAALTDENTCMDGFAGRHLDGNIKAAIRRRVNNVAQVTSNALALVNHFAERRQAAAAADKP